MKHLRWPLLIGMVLLAACAGTGRMPPPAVSRLPAPDADRMVRMLTQKNADLAPYKGIGQIGIQRGDRSWSVRAAWVAAPDGRMRVAALSLTGQAFARMICDEHQCYFIFQDQGCLRRETGGDRSLEPLAGVDLTAGDLALLLGGGVPVADFDSAAAYSTASGEKLLVLKKRLFGTVQTVRFSADGARVRAVTVYGWGGPDYRAEITRQQVVDGRRMPFGLLISNEGDDRLHVSVERAWVNVKLSDGAFSAELPEGSRCD